MGSAQSTQEDIPHPSVLPARRQTQDPTTLLRRFAAEDTGSMTALQWASDKGHVKLVKHLLEQADVDIDYHTTATKWEPSHSTALRLAVIFGSKAIVKMLLEKGASITIQDIDGDTILHDAVMSQSTPPPFVEWDDWSGTVQTTDERREILRLLLEKGPDLSLRNKRGCTALHFTDNNICREMLLDHGAVVDALDNRGYTPLHCAVGMNSEVGVKLLLERGADHSIKDPRNGLTLLHEAAARGYLVVTAALIDGGADVGVKNNDELIPVDYIRTVSWSESRGRYWRMVLLLLRASGMPESECRAICDERHQGDKPAHDKALKERLSKVDEWVASIGE